MKNLIDLLTLFCSENGLTFTYGFNADIAISPNNTAYLFLQLPTIETFALNRASTQATLQIGSPAAYSETQDLSLPVYDYLRSKVVALSNFLSNQVAGLNITSIAQPRATNEDSIGYQLEISYSVTIC